jgi:hypothetical protein
MILSAYVAVADEIAARQLERYFKSGSRKAFEKKRFLAAGNNIVCLGEPQGALL